VTILVRVVQKIKQVCSLPLRREQAFFMPLLIDHFAIHRVHDSTLYVAALTHASFHAIREKGYRKLQLVNERLEFLGDAVLELVVSDYLFARFPNMAEGKLTRLRANIVCRENLNSLARTIGIEDYLRTGLQKTSATGVDILGNAYEALIGAIYLEHGYATVYKIIVKQVLESGFIDWASLHGELYDYRSIVLHWSQREHANIEYVYNELTKKPSLFECKLFLEGVEKACGNGRNKKMAVQAACKSFVETYLDDFIAS